MSIQYEVVIGPAAIRAVLGLQPKERKELAAALRTELLDGPNADKEVLFDKVYKGTPLSFGAYVAVHRPMTKDELRRLRREQHRRVATAGFYVLDILPHRAASRLTKEPPVTIYLADEADHEQVEIAVEGWLASADLAIEERDRPVIGSWFRRLRVGVKQAAHSSIIQDAALTAVHAADTRLTLYQDAQTTTLLLQNLGPVLTALQPTKDAVIRAGALLIVKVEWQVQVFQLTAAQQLVLDHHPQLATTPREIFEALELQSAGSGPLASANVTARAMHEG